MLSVDHYTNHYVNTEMQNNTLYYLRLSYFPNAMIYFVSFIIDNNEWFLRNFYFGCISLHKDMKKMQLFELR